MAVLPPQQFPPLPPEVRTKVLAAEADRPGAEAVAHDLVATVITFERPEGLRQILASLAEQTTVPVRVIVVDNGGSVDDSALRILPPRGCEVVLLSPPRNVGPAGATALAMSLVLGTASRVPGWFTVLNDDLVFSHRAILEEMLAFAHDAVAEDPAVAAVGRIGHRFDRSWARLRRPPEADRAERPARIEVDYLTTGSARAGVGQPVPMFNLAAVREAGPFWGELFIGMTEVEFGLRLRRRGYRLLASGEMWRQAVPPGIAAGEEQGAVERTPRRRYYSVRNLVVIARLYGRPWTAVWVTVSRAGARLVHFLRRPDRAAWSHLRATITGIADGWRWRLGERGSSW